MRGEEGFAAGTISISLKPISWLPPLRSVGPQPSASVIQRGENILLYTLYAARIHFRSVHSWLQRKSKLQSVSINTVSYILWKAQDHMHTRKHTQCWSPSSGAGECSNSSVGHAFCFWWEKAQLTVWRVTTGLSQKLARLCFYTCQVFCLTWQFKMLMIHVKHK